MSHAILFNNKLLQWKVQPVWTGPTIALYSYYWQFDYFIRRAACYKQNTGFVLEYLVQQRKIDTKPVMTLNKQRYSLLNLSLQLREAQLSVHSKDYNNNPHVCMFTCTRSLHTFID
jgi:hypothetical protein